MVELLYDAGARDVALLPYNPLGMELGASLGMPRPALPAAFMNPEKEKKVYDAFEKLLAEKGSDRQAV
jgi:hypothetical protein